MPIDNGVNLIVIRPISCGFFLLIKFVTLPNFYILATQILIHLDRIGFGRRELELA